MVAILMKDARTIDRREPKHRKLKLADLSEQKLADLREHRGLTQEKVAKRARITQSEVSRTELREDCRLSTLKRYAAALGGRLRVHVEFDGELYPVTL
jgi:transcriptional regulator with XRE-family HTH domain